MTYKDLPGEQWRNAPGYPGYLVSNLGRVVSFRRHRTGKLMQAQPQYSRRGSRWVITGRTVTLRPLGGGGRAVSLSRLVAVTWLPQPQEVFQHQVARHIDGDVTNDAASNLFWDQPGRRRSDV